MTFAGNIINAPSWITVNAYSALLLLFILITCWRNKERFTKDGRIFTHLAFICFINVIFDVLATLPWDGSPTNEYLLKIANFFNYTLTTLLFVIYSFFVYEQISSPNKKHKNIIIISLFVLFLADAAVCFTSIFKPIYFYFDQTGYHRGQFFYIHVIFLILMAFLIEDLSIGYRKHINRKLLKYLLLFPIMPFIGMALQIVFYGVPLGLAFTSSSILIIFYFRTSRSMEIDYLTNTFNRRKLDSALYQRIHDAKTGPSFGAILIDIDNFKKINDTLGHMIGDEALEDAVNILKSTLQTKEDFIARYGGDEFCLVTDVTDPEKLKMIVDNINARAEVYNTEKNRSFKLGFSMGYASYDPKSNMSLYEFFNLIDKKMYLDKKDKLGGDRRKN